MDGRIYERMYYMYVYSICIYGSIRMNGGKDVCLYKWKNVCIYGRMHVGLYILYAYE